ncbi:hypothetical protein [Pseudomonas sp. 65/3-MNA-CIBAN-0223]|uniref:hypothetical protein n=1 Tax=Pseudomonas sp. 65/3-MNA-CIBAN-0223 TaxID=3140476 RepID=UPI00331F4E71
MAVHRNDMLARILDDTNQNRRHDIWLWFQLKAQKILLGGEINYPGMHYSMNEAIFKNPILSEKLKQREIEQLLPEKYISWIKEENRQVIWLRSKIRNDIMHPPEPGLTGKDSLVASIDLWNININEKGHFLGGLERDWNEHSKGDKQYKWFSDDAQKCIYAGNLIKKDFPMIGFSSIKLSDYLPIQCYEDLLIFFDNCKLHLDEKNAFIEKVKRKWPGKQYRDNMVGKKQYNFILSDQAIARLDKLSDTYELSRAKILDILLKMEDEQNRYIPERIKLLKDES